MYLALRLWSVIVIAWSIVCIWLTTGYLTKDHWKVARLSFAISRVEVRRRAQWTCGNFQGACSRLGTDLGLHGILRGVPGSVSWNTCCCGRLWLQGLDFIWPWRENEKALSRAGKRTTCDDGHHRHVLSRQIISCLHDIHNTWRYVILCVCLLLQIDVSRYYMCVSMTFIVPSN